jgi:hypothetical protein
MMADYIKREDVEKVLRDAHINRPLDSDRWVIAQISEGVAKIPAADVRENVRGRWKEKIIGNPAGGGTLCVSICVCCGVRVYATAVKCDLNYCPNCGADMRGFYDDAAV